MKTAALSLLLLPQSCHAERDPNAPWGDNPPKKFRMYWKDASNVLEDITEFDYLYIKFHGCVWSEYGIDNFDDDGEYRDGDENWYQGRTTSFRANAAYSLYGKLRNKPHFGRRCSKKTYINSFFTYMGADTISDSLNLGTFDDPYGYGHDYCSQSVSYADDDSAASTTMGCSLSTPNEYVTAVFSDDYCEGMYFLNTTNVLTDYNKAMQGVTCEKVWDYSSDYSRKARRLEDAEDDYSSYSSSTTYGSVAETLLGSSLACDLVLYGDRCPDPYGKKRQYENAVTGNVFGVRFANAVKRPLRIMSTIALLVGISLASFAYYVKNKNQVDRVVSDMTKSTGLMGDSDVENDDKDPDVEVPPKKVRSRTRSKERRRRRRRKSRSDVSEEVTPVEEYHPSDF